jgi:hypothetical protein
VRWGWLGPMWCWGYWLVAFSFGPIRSTAHMIKVLCVVCVGGSIIGVRHREMKVVFRGNLLHSEIEQVLLFWSC